MFKFFCFLLLFYFSYSKILYYNSSIPLESSNNYVSNQIQIYDIYTIFSFQYYSKINEIGSFGIAYLNNPSQITYLAVDISKKTTYPNAFCFLEKKENWTSCSFAYSFSPNPIILFFKKDGSSSVFFKNVLVTDPNGIENTNLSFFGYSSYLTRNYFIGNDFLVQNTSDMEITALVLGSKTCENEKFVLGPDVATDKGILTPNWAQIKLTNFKQSSYLKIIEIDIASFFTWDNHLFEIIVNGNRLFAMRFDFNVYTEKTICGNHIQTKRIMMNLGLLKI